VAVELPRGEADQIAEEHAHDLALLETTHCLELKQAIGEWMDWASDTWIAPEERERVCDEFGARFLFKAGFDDE
jgi:hypothetical protein